MSSNQITRGRAHAGSLRAKKATFGTATITTLTAGTIALTKVTVSVNPASIGAGLIVSTNVTVAGVVAGTTVIATPPAALEAGVVPISAIATGADTVALRLYNPTAAPIDPAAANWVFTIVG